MFSFAKRKIHEPENIQLDEVSKAPFGILCASGLNCDHLPQGRGPFGTNFNNPIPVNGKLGTFKYLNKLYVEEGSLFYHRLGSLGSDVTDYPIDAYEIVTWNGKWWDILFFDIYHPRRSNLAPEHYFLRKYKQNPLGDIAYGFGADIFCPHFPFDLPSAVEQVTGMPAFGRRVKDNIENNNYERPNAQNQKLISVEKRLHKQAINYKSLALTISSQIIGMVDEAIPHFVNALMDNRLDENQVGIDHALTTELIIFSVHLVDRIAFRELGTTQRELFIDALLPIVQQELQVAMSSQFLALYNTRNEFYGRFQHLYPGHNQPSKGTLFWEFGKALGAVYAGSNPVRIMNAASLGLTIYETLLNADFFNLRG